MAAEILEEFQLLKQKNTECLLTFGSESMTWIAPFLFQTKLFESTACFDMIVNSTLSDPKGQFIDYLHKPVFRLFLAASPLSHCIEVAQGSDFYGTENEIWGGFGQVCNTKK